MNQEYSYNYDDIPATCIPYWDEKCGEFFHVKEELDIAFKLFENKLKTYKPREYILENLSMDKCEEKLIDLIKNN